MNVDAEVMPMPIITIFCAFTRPWAVARWLQDLRQLDHDPSMVNLVFIIDCDEPGIFASLSAFAEAVGYRKWFIHMNKNWEPNEVRIAVRRKRIADIKEQSKQFIEQCDGDIILSLEDDTIFANLDLSRLISPLYKHEDVAFVEGVQCGRWGVKMIGAWHIGPLHDPTYAETLMPLTQPDYEEIDAGGWYGYVTPRAQYLAAQYAWNDEPWGPDVNYGLWLRRSGYRCVIDWQTVFGHNDHGTVGWPYEGIEKISYNKSPANGEWRRTDEAASSNPS